MAKAIVASFFIIPALKDGAKACFIHYNFAGSFLPRDFVL